MTYEDLVNKLIKKTARLFYAPHHTVILDILLTKLLLFDTELYAALKIHPKEFNKLIAKLKEDKLIKCENKIENADGRQTVRQVFFLDFCQIKDVIKYKIYKMSRSLEEKSKGDLFYACKICGKEFTLLDAQSRMENFMFKCDDCLGELDEKKNIGENGLDVHKKMMESISDIIILLKEIDKHDVDNIDYFQALKLREEKEKRDEDQNKVRVADEVAKKKKDNLERFKEYEEKTEEFTEDVYESREVVEEDVKRITDVVVVCGEEKFYDEITEEDKEKMTEEEYVKYYDVFMKHNQAEK